MMSPKKKSARSNKPRRVIEMWNFYEPRAMVTDKVLSMRSKIWESFEDMFGGRPPDTITLADVEEWRDSRKWRLQPTTMNMELAACSAVWTTLERMDMVGANPFKKARRLPVKKSLPKFLPWGDAIAILDKCAAHSTEMGLAATLMLMGGLRIGEVLRARWEDVDWVRGTMLVNGTKTDASLGTIKLHPSLRERLEPYRGGAGLMVTMSESSLRCKWAALAPGVTPHQMRHTIATHLLDLGHSLAEVAVFLRHGSIASTKIYADLRGVGIDVGRL